MHLTDVVWPVYYIGDKPPSTEAGITYYVDHKEHILIIDNKNEVGESLATRRLKMLAKGESLYKLNKAFFFLGDFIKFSKKGRWFIDNSGTLFSYKKSQYVKLECRKITRIIPSVGCTLLEIEGTSTRFKVLFPPILEEKYAGILRLNNGYIFYGFFREPFDATKRKV